MTPYPRKDPKAQTGSNLRGRSLRKFREAQLAQEKQSRERIAKAHYRVAKKLISKADVRRAAEIARQLNAEWRKASVKAGSDSVGIDALKVSARAKLERRLARELAGYREWKALEKVHLREQGKITQATLTAALPGVSIDWGDLVAIDSDIQEFGPSFTTFDVQMIDFGGFVVEDNSFAKPQIGHLVNNYSFDQNESTSIGAGLLGILPIENATSMTSCGVAFTTPSAGRLSVSAVVRNFYNKLTFSVSDKFGFSSAEVGIGVGLFVAVVRGTKVEILRKNLLSTGLISHGSDLSYTESDLDDTTPYTISVETQTRFEANESVLVLAGTEVGIGTILDDMHCRMSAVLWWKLEKLAIGMAIDVIT